MIEFSKIIIEGFCSIPQLELSLNNNHINIIRAPNGYGKSTIFSAIVWALYGKNIKGGSSVNTWEKYQTKDYQGTMVSIFFTKDNSTHNIIRCQNYKGEIEGAKGSNRLVYMIDAAIVRNKDKYGIQDLINKNIGISYSLFLNSIMFGQGLKRLIQETGSDKKNLFEEIFDLKYITKARDIAKGLLSDNQKVKDRLENDIHNRSVMVEDKASLLRDFESQKDKASKDTEKEVNKYKKEIRILELNFLPGLEKEILILGEKVKNLEGRLDQIKEETQSIIKKREKVISKTKIPILDLIDEVIKLLSKKSYKEAIDTLLGIKKSFKEKESLTKELELKQEEKELLMRGYFKEKDGLKSKTHQLNSLKSKISEYKSRIKSAKQYKDTRYLDKMISKTKKEIQQLETEMVKLNQALKAVEEKVFNYSWAVDVFGNNGLKSFLFESSLTQLNEILKKYSEVLGFDIQFGVDLLSARKDFLIKINLEGVPVFYEELSGGQKQLVNLAMALAMNEIQTQAKGINIAFLDEVFDSLSMDNIEVVTELIKAAYKDKTLFLITHLASLPIPNSKTITVKRIKGLSYYDN